MDTAPAMDISGGGPKGDKRSAVMEELKNAETLMQEEMESGLLGDEMRQFENLDLTNDDINFEEIDDLMSKFQQDPMMKEAMEKGIDIREYWRQVEADLREVEKRSLNDYMQEAENIALLYRDIESCDSILATMEDLLNKFQHDLGNISQEIRTLQQQSSSMSVKLKNRKAVSDELSRYVTQLAVPPSLVQSVCQDEVNDSYAEYLMQLHKKMSFAASQEKSILAARDVMPELDKLKMKAVIKIREFLLQNVYTLRKPGTNIQIIQSSRLLKFKYLNRFLYKYSKEYAMEVRKEYEDTMARIYTTYFREYINGLHKLQGITYGSRNDLIGVEESEMKGFFSDKFSKTRTNVFSLGVPSRACLLDDLEEPQIVLNEAAQRNSKHPYEVLFRSINHYLKDAVTAEYFFDREFFGKLDLIQSLFGKSIQYCVDSLSHFLSSSYDAIGILILICVVDEYKEVMKARKVPALHSYHERILSMLWERFNIVFRSHCESLSSCDVEKIAGASLDIRPHYITRRYAEFATAIGFLCCFHSTTKQRNSSTEDHSVSDSLSSSSSSSSLSSVSSSSSVPADEGKRLRLQKPMENMRKRMENFIIKMVKLPLLKSKKNRILFLINNYDHILSVFENRGVENEDSVRFRSLMDAQVSTFVEIIIAEHFGPLVQFVKAIHPKLHTDAPNPPQQKVAELVSDFAKRWKSVLEKINQEILTHFFNFLTGGNILKQVLTQLALYYTRFEEIIRKCFRQSEFKLQDFVPTPTLTYQIKKMSMAFTT